MTAFPSLDDNDPMVVTISLLGEGHISMSTDDVSATTPAMAASVKSVGTAKVYAPKSSTQIISELRWELLRAINLESDEMLPPTVATLIPHIQRVNYMVMSYETGVTLLRITHSRILRVMAGRSEGCQSSASYPLHPVPW